MRMRTSESPLGKPFLAGCAGLLMLAGLTSVQAAQDDDAALQGARQSQLSAAVRKNLAVQDAELRALRREIAAQKKLMAQQDRQIAKIEHDQIGRAHV